LMKMKPPLAKAGGGFCVRSLPAHALFTRV